MTAETSAAAVGPVGPARATSRRNSESPASSIGAVLLSAILAAGAFGQEPAKTPPAAPSQQGEVPKPAAPPRTLDDLLGIGGSKDAAPTTPRPSDSGAGAKPASGEDGNHARLDRSLNEQDLNDAFKEAIEGMKRSTDLLASSGDAGVETQRVQEDVVRRLDSLIEAAKKLKKQQQQQNQKGNRKSNRSDRDQSKQQDDQGDRQDEKDQKQGNRPQDQSQQAAGNRQRGSRPGQAEAPELQEGELNNVMEEGRVEWGNLPARIRDLVQQGRRDRISSLYQRLTEQYYRRMAEEASK